MSIQLTVPQKRELKPRIVVLGVGGAGGNAVNNMIKAGLEGVDFIVANTDAQALTNSKADRRIQIGSKLTEGLGAGSNPEIGRQAAEESMAEIVDMLQGSHMAFVTAGMGGGTGTGAAPVIARAAREQGILTVGVVTKPFDFEGVRRMKSAIAGIEDLAKEVDTLIIIPNQNLFRVANAQTTFAEAFGLADEVLHSGVAGITDLMIKPGLINLDFADVRTVMNEMGKAMMGTGEAGGDNRAIESAEAAIANPLLDDVSMQGARGVLINISGGQDMTLYEVDEAANRIKQEVDEEANIIIGSTFDDTLDGIIRVSVVATGIDAETQIPTNAAHLSEVISITPEQPEEAVPTPPLPTQTSEAMEEEGIQEGEAHPAEMVEKPEAGSELPGFLQPKPMAAPRRELPKRSRSFLDRVLGKNRPEGKESHQTERMVSVNVAAEMPSLAARSEEPDATQDEAHDTAQDDLQMPNPDVANIDAEDGQSPVQTKESGQPKESAQPKENDTPLVAETHVAEGLPEGASEAAKIEATKAEDAQTEIVQPPELTAPAPATPTPEAQEKQSVEASVTEAVSQPPAQASMPTTPSASSASLDGDQLDIPAFLRR
ncbi:MAG: cell division protein FtsZ [Parvibaculales bacterium]